MLNHARSHLPYKSLSSYENHVHYQSEDSCAQYMVIHECNVHLPPLPHHMKLI